MSDILDSLGISEEAKTSLEKIALNGVIRDSEPLKLTHIDNQLVIAGADTNMMQRSGARSELEAIAAGLRSLRAPSQRKITPKTREMPTKR